MVCVGPTFVTRKITRAVVRIAVDEQECLYLGNIDSLRDWGHAKDYVRVNQHGSYSLIYSPLMLKNSFTFAYHFSFPGNVDDAAARRAQ